MFYYFQFILNQIFNSLIILVYKLTVYEKMQNWDSL